MRIGVDLRSLEAGAQHRGIGRYATELLYALSSIDHENEYVFFTSHPKITMPNLTLNKDFSYTHTTGRTAGLRSVKYIRIIFLAAKPLPIDRYSLDVFFHIDTTKPIRRGKTPVVSVLYDLIPFLYKDLYQYVPLNGYTPGHIIGYSRAKLYWKLQEKWLHNFKKDAAIISISEHSKKDLLAYIPDIQAKKIHAIPLAAGRPQVIDQAARTSMKKLDLKSFLFYVGGADPRKGLVSLVKSMEDVWAEFPDTQLVLAGKEVTDMKVEEAVRLRDTAAASSRPKHIVRLGFITDGELAWLYSHAKAFVFPSKYEGFGLPILEAMQAGCPVITYDNSSLPEVTGSSAIVIKNGQSMVPSICKLLGDPKFGKKLSEAGMKQAAKFSWDITARETLTVLTKVGRKRK